MVKKKVLLLFFSGFVCHFTVQAQGSYRGISDEHPTGSDAIDSNGLVAAYDFETFTTEGLLKDFGPFGNDGVVTRRQETEGLFGKARVFTTLEDLVDLPENSSFDLPGPLTIATWIQFSTPDLHQHIFNCDELFVLWTTAQNQFRLADTQANGITTTPGSVDTGNWHSVIAVLSATRGEVLDQGNIQIYVDGQLTEGNIGPTWSPASLWEEDGCFIGVSKSGDEQHQSLQFEGIIDELHVYSRALSDPEIQAYSTRGNENSGDNLFTILQLLLIEEE